MLKKIVLTTLLVGFIGILVWGGINRTMAKAADNEGNQNVELIGFSGGNGAQQQSKDNRNLANHTEEGLHKDANSNQGNSVSQSQNSGNGFQSDPVNGSVARVGDAQTSRRGNGNGNGQGQGGNPLTATEIEALYMALDDEYHALAVYQSVIATFGNVEPFVEIAQSEQKHIDALVNQFNKYGLTVPENPWIGNVPTFDSLQQACQTGVEAEIANADLYNQLFSMIDDARLTRVFTNLSNASLNSHLPQFEACQ